MIMASFYQEQNTPTNGVSTGEESASEQTSWNLRRRTVKKDFVVMVEETPNAAEQHKRSKEAVVC
jgi:hypothetical protein